MSSGYAITNSLAGLAATSFTWSSAYTTNRNRLNDGKQDELAASAGSAQASGQTLVVDLGGASPVAAIALLSHNLASGACTVRVRGADDAAITTNVVTAKAATTINTSAPYEKDTVLQFPSVTKRYWELTFTHTGSKIVALGELLFFSVVTTLTRQSTWGSGERERFIKNEVASRTGNIRSTFVGGPIRSMTLLFKDMVGEAQRDELMTMWRSTQGGTKNMLWLENIDSSATAGSAASQRCLWVKMQESMGWTYDDFALFGVEGFELRGLGRQVGA